MNICVPDCGTDESFPALCSAKMAFANPDAENMAQNMER